MPATKEAVDELFDDIDAAYFIEEGFDPIAYELKVVLFFFVIYLNFFVIENGWS